MITSEPYKLDRPMAQIFGLNSGFDCKEIPKALNQAKQVKVGQVRTHHI